MTAREELVLAFEALHDDLVLVDAASAPDMFVFQLEVLTRLAEPDLPAELVHWACGIWVTYSTQVVRFIAGQCLAALSSEGGSVFPALEAAYEDLSQGRYGDTCDHEVRRWIEHLVELAKQMYSRDPVLGRLAMTDVNDPTVGDVAVITNIAASVGRYHRRAPDMTGLSFADVLP